MSEERIPPQKIRITKLQEAQLLDLQAMEAGCAQMFYDIGYTEDEIRPRGETELGRLTRDHDVLVAEADNQTAGFLVWADQAPGVAWLSTLAVAPDYQRFGIATRMLRELGELAHSHGIEQVVTPCWGRAAWALAFLAVRGFEPLEGALADKLSRWKALSLDKDEAGAALVQPGQNLWWAKSDGLGTVPGLPRPDSVG